MELLSTRVVLLCRGRMIELPLGEYVLGRSSKCSLRFNDASVSRKHVRFVVARDGVIVGDLGSKNGTRVNGLPLAQEVSLAHGDEIEVGQLKVEVLLQPEGEFYEEDTISLTDRKNPFLDSGEGERVDCPGCHHPIAATLDSCPHCGCLVSTGRATCLTQELPLFDPDE